MHYYEIDIFFNKKNYEQLYNVLYYNGVQHILEEEGFLKIYIEDNLKWKIEELRNTLTNTNIIPEKDFVIKKVENKNWNKEWEKTIEPVFIKNKIIVYPSWKKNKLKDTKDKILIEIDPKMSFGTGHNETTQIILEMMAENLDGKEKKLLDFGSGTGILAIAAAKMGIEKVTAIEIDEISIENAKEYFKINETENIRLLKSDIKELKKGNFDVICANIISGVIIENLPEIYGRLVNNGKLFATGILKVEERDITDKLEKNDFEILKKYYKAEWLGIYAIKKQPDSSN
ncbi:MAG TPA: 50S ribosomal protein L11 methyltransferase [Ignavibacteria bacterium]|nr:50S ribosomal protein L11 methyltransferase [Ignavibacteria bacterium]